MRRCPYWVTRRVGGCPLPWPGAEEALRRAGVTLLVSLVEPEEFYDAWPGGEREFLEAMESAGIRVIRLPTPDFGAPDIDEACRVLGEAWREVRSGGKVVFHCYGGIGRTGTMLVAYLHLCEGMPMEEALEIVRRYGAGPQSAAQEYFLYYIRLKCAPAGRPQCRD